MGKAENIVTATKWGTFKEIKSIIDKGPMHAKDKIVEYCKDIENLVSAMYNLYSNGENRIILPLFNVRVEINITMGENDLLFRSIVGAELAGDKSADEQTTA